MKATLKFRSVVFKRAYLIVKETGCNFSEALKQAWIRYREYKNRIAKELADRMNSFDYYFHYADDSRVYRYWTIIKAEIREQVLSMPISLISAIQSQLKANSNISVFIK